MEARFVSENIQFERGKSPMDAMSIGREAQIQKEFITYWDAGDWAVRNLELITDDKYSPNDVIRKVGDHGMPEDLVAYLQRWVEKVELTGYPNSKNEAPIVRRANLLTEIAHQLRKHGILVEAVNFERGRDPKEAMGLGLLNKRDFDSNDEVAEWMINYSWRTKKGSPLDRHMPLSEDDFYLKRKQKFAGLDHETFLLGEDIRLRVVKWIRWNIKINGKNPLLIEAKFILEDIEEKLRDLGRIKIK